MARKVVSNKLYNKLGVSSDVSPDDIKKAFRSKAKACHPDHHPGDPAKETEFKEISNAYMILGDPARRKKYDETGDDAPKIDDSHQKAVHMVLMLFKQIMIQNGDNIFYIDIIGTIEGQVRRIAQDALADARKTRKENCVLEKVIERLVFKGGENSFVHLALKNEQQENKNRIKSAQQGIVISRKALKIARQYEFQPDRKSYGMDPDTTTFPWKMRTETVWGTR